MATIYGQALRDPQSAVAKSLAGCVVFNIDEIARYYWQSEKTDWNVTAGDFPNIAPPYPHFFMQYSMPRGTIVVEEGQVEIQEVEQYGFAFHAEKLDPDDQQGYYLQGKLLEPSIRWVYSFSLYTYIPSLREGVYHDSLNFMIGVDGLGQFVPLWGNSDRPMLIDYPRERIEEMQNEDTRTKIVHAVFSVLHPCFLAISFLHTKNTLVVENKPEAVSRSARRRTARKSGEPNYTFHTLDIRPLREVLARERGDGQPVQDIARAAHLRRGHFRDYQDGRGLFGRYHGLYWFDSTFVRGRGQADKDYRIHLPKSNPQGDADEPTSSTA